MTRRPILVMAAALLLAAGACGGGNPSPAPPSPVTTPAPAGLGPASLAARDALFDVLGGARLLVAESPIPYRPAEAGTLAAAPRTVYQVALPEEPDNGFIVVYELPDEAAAIDAAQEQRTYLLSGPGRVQSPLGTDHVLQQLGATVVYYNWLPGASVDPAAPRIADALRGIGTALEVQD